MCHLWTKAVWEWEKQQENEVKVSTLYSAVIMHHLGPVAPTSLEINFGANLYLAKISLQQPQFAANGYLNPDLS